MEKKYIFNMPEKPINLPYSTPPLRFINREYFVIQYETDPEILKNEIPKGLKFVDPVVKYQFVKMPDAWKFGSVYSSGNIIPVSFEGIDGNYEYAMFFNSPGAISSGREIFGFPKKFANPNLEVDNDSLLGTLHYGKDLIATGTMGYKHNELKVNEIEEGLKKPLYLFKTIPNVDGTPLACQINQVNLIDIKVKGAWSGPATLELHPHALADVAKFPIKKIISATHYITDYTIPFGKTIIDYLKN
jgi:acetoacetate decarboxylase